MQAVVLAEMKQTQAYVPPQTEQKMPEPPREEDAPEPLPEADNGAAQIQAVRERVELMERQVRENEAAAAAEEKRRREEARQRALDDQLA